jgi:plexin A
MCMCEVSRYIFTLNTIFMCFQQFIVQTRFVCQFNIEGRVTSVNAQLLGDTIYCDPMEFSYTSRAPNITATFAVIWGGSKPLDNPDNVHGKSDNS